MPHKALVVSKGRSIFGKPIDKNGKVLTGKDPVQYLEGTVVTEEAHGPLDRLIEGGFVEEQLIDEDAPKATGKPLENIGKFNKNPKDLQGKDLKQLNVMIQEIDSKGPEAKSVDEAIKILSKDFKSA